jgi:hypothetical protein
MDDRSRELPKEIQTQVNSMPEHSYGVNLVSVRLKDGRVVRDVYVGWAIDVLKVGRKTELSFDPRDVVAVQHQDRLS